MRGDRGEHEDQGLDGIARRGVQAGQVVVEDDELRDCGVDAQVLVLFGDLGDRAGHEATRLVVRGLVGDRELAGLLIDHVTPQALQESLGADDGAGLPRARQVEGAHAHLVHAEDVGTIGVVHLIGRDDVLQGLAHLAVLAAHGLTLVGEAGRLVTLNLVGGHVLAACVGVGVGLDVALVEERVVGLGVRHVAQVEENLLPEAGVEQVQDRVLDAADIHVGAAANLALARAHPVGKVLLAGETLGVRRVGVAHLVPARARPLGHRVGLAAVGLGAIAQVERDVHPFLGATQRGLGRGVGVVRVEGARAVVADLGQLDGEHVLGQRVRHAVLVPHDRERLTPVALAAEQPVAQAVGDGAVAQALGDQPLDHGSLRLVLGQAVQVDLVVRGVDGHTVTRVRAGLEVGAVGVSRGADRAHDVEVVGAGEGPVAVVVGGHGHDGAGAVAPQDVVGDEDRDGAAVDRIDAEQAGEHAGLGALLVGTLGLGLRGGLGAVGGNGGRGGGGAARPRVLRALGPGGGQSEDGLVAGVAADGSAENRVLGGDDHEGRTEQRVGARRVNVQGVEGGAGLARAGHVEAHGRALGAADPVALHRAHLLRPVDRVEVVGQALAIGGDAHHPLAQVALEDREVAALGAAIRGHLFVGEDRAQARAPVDGGLGDVGEAVGVDDLRLRGAIERGVVGSVLRANLAGLELGDQLTDRAGRALGAVGGRSLGIEPRVEDL